MRATHLEDYYSFLRFPSVSTDNQFADQVRDCAHWVAKKLNGIGLESEVVATTRAPDRLGEQ